MKVVILAGGKGTRISEESRLRPKPMVEIGGKPILWHIMRQYASFGFQEFVVCCGYKGHMIKEYFVNYYRHNSQVPVRYTGLETLTAGRILRAREYIGEEPFLLTYGDGVSNVNIQELVQFHKRQKRIVTISTIQPEGRFGALCLDEAGESVSGFREKAREDQPWVNIGFMVMEPEVYQYLGDGSEMLERGPFEKLASDGEMAAYKHKGFWSPMDNMHDREYLENLWDTQKAPWKV